MENINILELNEISPKAHEILPDNYKMSKNADTPAGIMLRSFSMHEYEMPASVIAVARAGAGVNNIPVDKYAEKGVVVFNTPGANANAVKELVICALMLSSRKIIPAIEWAQGLKGNGAEVAKMVEKGKSKFVGAEILGKTLGVIGLGAIGAQVANAAVDLGMNVIGYDPFVSVETAWNISHFVKRETDLKRLLRESDYITLHLPYNNATKGMINADAISNMKNGVCIINCARAELADTVAVVEAAKSGKIGRYVTDFPVEETLGVENIVPIPHLGASTPEAEDNCAIMAARQICDYIDNGNITNGVNFPDCVMPRSGAARLCLIHRNVQNVISRVSEIISGAGINIGNMLSHSRGNFAYAIFELDDKINAKIVEKIEKLDITIRLRVI